MTMYATSTLSGFWIGYTIQSLLKIWLRSNEREPLLRATKTMWNRAPEEIDACATAAVFDPDRSISTQSECVSVVRRMSLKCAHGIIFPHRERGVPQKSLQGLSSYHSLTSGQLTPKSPVCESDIAPSGTALAKSRSRGGLVDQLANETPWKQGDRKLSEATTSGSKCFGG